MVNEDTEYCHLFYESALNYIMNSEFKNEMEIQDNLVFDRITPEQFMSEFAFVVLSAGMKNQVVVGMMKKLVDSDWNPDVINHDLKRKAIIEGINNYPKWFAELKSKITDREKVEYLETLPFIGKITKYHLAKNIGIDCVKPDRHLVLLAKEFKYENPRFMCEFLSKQFNQKLRVIDVVLWRYCNMYPDVMKAMKR